MIATLINAFFATASVTMDIFTAMKTSTANANPFVLCVLALSTMAPTLRKFIDLLVLFGSIYTVTKLTMTLLRFIRSTVSTITSSIASSITSSVPSIGSSIVWSIIDIGLLPLLISLFVSSLTTTTTTAPSSSYSNIVLLELSSSSSFSSSSSTMWYSVLPTTTTITALMTMFRHFVVTSSVSPSSISSTLSWWLPKFSSISATTTTTTMAVTLTVTTTLSLMDGSTFSSIVMLMSSILIPMTTMKWILFSSNNNNIIIITTSSLDVFSWLAYHSREIMASIFLPTTISISTTTILPTLSTIIKTWVYYYVNDIPSLSMKLILYSSHNITSFLFAPSIIGVYGWTNWNVFQWLMMELVLLYLLQWFILSFLPFVWKYNVIWKLISSYHFQYVFVPVMVGSFLLSNLIVTITTVDGCSVMDIFQWILLELVGLYLLQWIFFLLLKYFLKLIKFVIDNFRCILAVLLCMWIVLMVHHIIIVIDEEMMDLSWMVSISKTLVATLSYDPSIDDDMYCIGFWVYVLMATIYTTRSKIVEWIFDDDEDAYLEYFTNKKDHPDAKYKFRARFFIRFSFFVLSLFAYRTDVHTKVWSDVDEPIQDEGHGREGRFWNTEFPEEYKQGLKYWSWTYILLWGVLVHIPWQEEEWDTLNGVLFCMGDLPYWTVLSAWWKKTDEYFFDCDQYEEFFQDAAEYEHQLDPTLPPSVVKALDRQRRHSGSVSKGKYRNYPNNSCFTKDYRLEGEVEWVDYQSDFLTGLMTVGLRALDPPQELEEHLVSRRRDQLIHRPPQLTQSEYVSSAIPTIGEEEQEAVREETAVQVPTESAITATELTNSDIPIGDDTSDLDTPLDDDEDSASSIVEKEDAVVEEEEEETVLEGTVELQEPTVQVVGRSTYGFNWDSDSDSDEEDDDEEDDEKDDTPENETPTVVIDNVELLGVGFLSEVGNDNDSLCFSKSDTESIHQINPFYLSDEEDEDEESDADGVDDEEDDTVVVGDDVSSESTAFGVDTGVSAENATLEVNSGDDRLAENAPLEVNMVDGDVLVDNAPLEVNMVDGDVLVENDPLEVNMVDGDVLVENDPFEVDTNEGDDASVPAENASLEVDSSHDESTETEEATIVEGNTSDEEVLVGNEVPALPRRSKRLMEKAKKLAKLAKKTPTRSSARIAKMERPNYKV